MRWPDPFIETSTRILNEYAVILGLPENGKYWIAQYPNREWCYIALMQLALAKKLEQDVAVPVDAVEPLAHGGAYVVMGLMAGSDLDKIEEVLRHHLAVNLDHHHRPRWDEYLRLMVEDAQKLHAACKEIIRLTTH
jgi:hypothetical protein